MTEFMKKYKLKITVLSPVHIGAATDLEPTEYVIYSEKKEAKLSQKQMDSTVICTVCGHKNPANAEYCGSCDCELPRQAAPVRQTTVQTAADSYLYTFTPGQLSDALSEQPQYKNAFRNLVRREDRNALRELLDFFRKNAAPIAACATKRAKVRTGFVQEYNKILEPNGRYGDLWKLTVEALISDPVTGLPYIPGSSIKGAIRTALMSAKNEKRKLDNGLYKKAADAEKDLYDYKNPTNDPFKALKIEDGLASTPFITSIDTAENFKRKMNAASGQRVSTYMEVVPAGTVFESSLSIMQNEVFPDDMASIQLACNDFYSDILFDQEDQQIHTHGISAALFEKIRKSVEPSRRAFLLCLGKHGGAESKTIDGLRNIRIMQGKGKPARFDDHATTYWFANDGRERLPFGWCVVEFEEEK